jgi:Spy/CpxP family protein refolding chaperone
MKRTSLLKGNSLAVLIALLASAGLSGYAQRRQPPDPATMVQHRVDFLTQELGLSPAQQQQATTIFTEAAASQKSFHDQMKSAHESLQAAVTKNDAVAIDQVASSIGNLMAQSISAHAKTEAAFYQTLTPDQQSKYAQMHHGKAGMFGFHRPGLGGHPPF